MMTLATFKLWAVLPAAVVVALLTVIAAQGSSAHPNHEPSAGWFQRC